ncbi:hypothetical protein [Gloeothece citriformis]|uniref:hypothetical protein n=1 Tax=Gloeothece citriformis TaxID=2546356 RepID=UPI00059C6352|nr:hypothetical protein [Gloeothece citriformis]
MKILFESVESAKRIAEIFSLDSDGLNCVDFPLTSLLELREFLKKNDIEAYPLYCFCWYLKLKNEIVGVPLTSHMVWRGMEETYFKHFLIELRSHLLISAPLKDKDAIEAWARYRYR